MKQPPDTTSTNPVGLALISVFAIALAWHSYPALLLIVVPVVAWVFAQTITDNWWRERSRAFGKDLEQRALLDLTRIAKVLRLQIQTNLPVPGHGDADAVLGTPPILIEVKSFRQWEPTSPRTYKAIDQTLTLRTRLNLSEAIIWLPQGRLTTMQRLGFIKGLPPGIRLITGPAWRPALRCWTPWRR